MTVTTSAQGNSAAGAVESGGALTVQSEQDMRADVGGRTDVVLGGDTYGQVNVTTRAGGNNLAVSAYGSDLTANAVQSTSGGLVRATSEVGDSSARLHAGGQVAASAVSNSVALYGEGSFLHGEVDQTNAATVRAFGRIESQYIPAEAAATSEAIGNAVAATSVQTSGQNLAITQASTGDFLEADASANAGNAWNLAARARAAANQTVLYNAGGSVVAASDQNNTSFVRAAALTTAYDYGRAEAQARGVANELSIGNNDIYVEIDNSQFNSGGVDVSATFSGTNGYDVYVGADAVGNAVTGYACADCRGYLQATNDQTNNGDVTARATATVTGSNRAVIAGANAVGNSATFYVSRPNH